MSRRRVAALFVALIAVVAPTLSQPAAADDDAATVNGESVSVDAFDDVVTSAAESGEFQLDTANGVVDAASGRGALQLLITNVALRQFLEEHDIEAVSDSDRAAAAEELDQQTGGTLVGQAREVVIERNLLTGQIAEVEVPGVDELSELYDSQPASVGVLCARIIAAADMASGAEVVDALEAGEAFGSVGEEFSIEPGFADSRGSLTGDPTQTCIPLSGVQGAGSELAGPLVNARPGEPIGPVETQAGVLVLVVDSFDDASASIADLYENPPSGESAGQLLFDGWLLSADVSVNPRFGRWDPSTASIVPLGQG